MEINIGDQLAYYRDNTLEAIMEVVEIIKNKSNTEIKFNGKVVKHINPEYKVGDIIKDCITEPYWDGYSIKKIASGISTNNLIQDLENYSNKFKT